MSTVHVVGAGVAGLACAVRLAARGVAVALHEGAGHAGGRCRSFHEPALDRRIDNGNHLLLSGNLSVRAFLDETGAADGLVGPQDARMDFLDLASGVRWQVRPNAGPLPWWFLVPGRRPPDSGPGDFLAALRLIGARPEQNVAEVFPTGRPAWRSFWRPLCVAVLNTAPEEAQAILLRPLLTEIFGRGAAAARPLVAREGLSETFVDPALAFLRARGVPIAFNRRLRAVETGGGRATALSFPDGRIELGEGDRVVLAIPPGPAASVLPALAVPDEHRAIVNAHYRLEGPAALPGGQRLLGLVGATSEWLFARGDVVSVTVSAADALAEEPAEAIAPRLWAEVTAALGRPGAPMPTHRIVKEKRATIAQTPAMAARRPGTHTPLANLFLAGDWTATGLPCTIEGAVRSGHWAAQAASPA